jgi:hypothetical protein
MTVTYIACTLREVQWFLRSFARESTAPIQVLSACSQRLSLPLGYMKVVDFSTVVGPIGRSHVQRMAAMTRCK